MKPTLASTFRLQQFDLRGIFVSTYIPRRCGIATYTKDLTNAMNVLNPQYFCEILAIDDEREKVNYPWEVKYRINRNNEKDYLWAAEYIDKSSCDYVCLQHEYGIFGGDMGDHILNLVHNIKKPLVTTFHTTVENPTPIQKEIIQRIAKESTMCVVMIDEAAKRLYKKYGVRKEKIVVIPHGVPNIPFSPSIEFKKDIGFSRDDFLIGSINLIAPNKGLEYMIRALPQIIKKVPNVKFLMIGQTHPLVKIVKNEDYRNQLKQLVKDLHVEKHFVEINEYVSLEDLVNFLKALDIYITPYLDLNQTSSGTLAYAIGAGKVCMATPYIYAKEMLKDGRGMLIKPKNEKAIAQAVIKVATSNKFRQKIEDKAYQYGRRMIWEHVALDYLNLLNYAVNK